MHTPRALRVLAVAALSLLISVGTIDPASIASGEGAVTGESCPGNGDVFEFDMPGTYTAFAVDGSGSVVTEVRGAHGRMLATTNSTAPSTAEVDLVSAARFDIASAQVFDVEAGVIINVQHGNLPYELVVVRVGVTEKSGIDIRPSLEHVVNESGPCLIGDLRDSYKIHAEAVSSDADARQVFLVESPNRLADR
jgi:hypothetical protein